VLNLGAITPNAGGTVNFTLPTGTQSATNGITTSTTNTNSILGGWARVGNDWAINSTNAVGGNIAALATYTDVSRLGGTITSNATSNLRIITGGGSGNITPAAPGVTDINTLKGTAADGTATYDPGTTDTLRLGAAGGILLPTGVTPLTIGAAANDGILTAGGADNTPGTIYLTNNHSTSILTINSIIADNGTGVVSVTTSGAGTTKLFGNNTYTGRTIIGGGVLAIASEAALGSNPGSFTADQIILAGGTLNNSATSFSLNSNRGITLAAAGGTFSVDTGTTLTVANVITGPGSLTKSGNGTLALTAANTHTGVTLLTANMGPIALGNTNALQNSTLDTGTAGTQSVTFTVAGTNTYNIGGLQGTDDLALGANTISVGANNATTAYTGIIGGTGGMTKVGTGTLNLTAASTYSGNTLVSGGMLVLANLNALQNSTLDTGTAGAQSVNLTATGTYNLGGLQGANGLDMAVSNLSVGSNNQSTTFSGVLSGAFGNNLTKVGTGTLTLSGANTHGGATTVNGGILTFLNTSAKASGTVTAAAAGAIGLGVGGVGFYSSADVDALFANTLTGFSMNAASGGAIDTSAGDFTYGTNQSAARALTKLGSNSLILTGANTYTGTTTIVAGTVQLGNGGTTGSLATTSAITNNANLAINRSNAVAQGTDFSAAGITGTGSFTQAGTGTTTLNAANSYGGGTMVTAGTLILANNSAAGSAGVTLSGAYSATLQIASGVTIANNITFSNTNATSSVNRQVANATAYTAGTSGGLTSTFAGGQADTTASILAGTNAQGSTATLAMKFSDTSAASNDGIRKSDVFTLNGTSTDLFTLQLSVTGLDSASYLGWLNGGSWVNAVSGNAGNNAIGAQLGYLGSFSAFQVAYGTTLSSYIGAYGVDTTGGSTWAVLNHNSDYAAVPEPATWALLAFSLTTVMVLRRRAAKS
jgi:autotransporter-associated beta strand protein